MYIFYMDLRQEACIYRLNHNVWTISRTSQLRGLREDLRDVARHVEE